MNFMTQLGVLAIILIILVILIKSNQTLEQIYMEGEPEHKTIEMPEFKMPKFRFSRGKEKIKNAAKRTWIYDESEKEDKTEEEKTVKRSFDTVPLENLSGWHVEMVDAMGRSYGRKHITSCPFTIGRAEDNDYVLDDLSVSGHHVVLEESENGMELLDRGSLNKILVGGRPVTKVFVVDRMEVFLGNTKIRFIKDEKASEYTVPYKKNSRMEEWY